MALCRRLDSQFTPYYGVVGILCKLPYERQFVRIHHRNLYAIAMCAIFVLRIAYNRVCTRVIGYKSVGQFLTNQFAVDMPCDSGGQRSLSYCSIQFELCTYRYGQLLHSCDRDGRYLQFHDIYANLFAICAAICANGQNNVVFAYLLANKSERGRGTYDLIIHCPVVSCSFG